MQPFRIPSLSANNVFSFGIQSLSMPPETQKQDSKMCAWQIHSYGDLGELRMSDCVRVPKLLSPDDILIEVFAASVNPIDIAMMGGYGSSLLNAIRRAKNCEFSGIEFPLSLGRDFSGIVVAKGYQVSGINVGDEVWGVVPPHSQGSHAGKVLVNKSLVIATCRTDATSLIESLGADGVIDYTHPDAWKMIKELGKYDIILDAAGLGSEKGTEYAQYLKDLEFSKYITLKSPLLHNVDQYGFVGGMIKNLVDIIVPNIKTNMISTGSTVRWGFFIPLAEALHEISHLTEEGRDLALAMTLVQDVTKFEVLLLFVVVKSVGIILRQHLGELLGTPEANEAISAFAQGSGKLDKN
ncbi:Uncharacterized protein GBIM_20610, partial [Gryllus bimaculatus]